MDINWTSDSKVMAFWICNRVPGLVTSVDILWVLIEHPSQKLWSLEFTIGFLIQFRVSWYVIGLNRTFDLKFMVISTCHRLPCSITRFLIYYGPQSNIQIKSGDRLNLSEASLFNYKCVDILWASNSQPCQKVMIALIFLRLHCWISIILIYYGPHSDNRVKSYDCLNFSGAFLFNF